MGNRYRTWLTSAGGPADSWGPLVTSSNPNYDPFHSLLRSADGGDGERKDVDFRSRRWNVKVAPASQMAVYTRS